MANLFILVFSARLVVLQMILECGWFVWLVFRGILTFVDYLLYCVK